MRLFFVSLLFVSLLTQAQTNPSRGSALVVEQSVPFGSISGQLLVLPQYLVFVDAQQAEASYVIPRDNVQSLDAQGQTIVLRTEQPVRDRAGNSSRINFRLLRGDAAVLTNWYGSGAADRVTTASPQTMYEATHDHLFGACHGRLIVNGMQLSYESIDDVDHSRRWEYASIRELSQPNPYELEIRPANGGEYKLKLGGSGMEPGAFKDLVEKVTAARAGAQ